MIWPSNGRPKAKYSMMTDDSMMTAWVRKGLRQPSNLDNPSIMYVNWDLNPYIKSCVFFIAKNSPII